MVQCLEVSPADRNSRILPLKNGNPPRCNSHKKTILSSIPEPALGKSEKPISLAKPRFPYREGIERNTHRVLARTYGLAIAAKKGGVCQYNIKKKSAACFGKVELCKA